MLRLFLAVPIAEKTMTKIGRKVDELKSTLADWDVRWVAPENLHVTLVFFGWVKEEQIEILKTEIGTAVSGFTPFETTTGNLSLKGRPLWLEIEQGQEELKQLGEKLAKKLTIKGSLAEERGFHAHLTLGRIKKRGKTKLPEVSPSFSWKAARLVLYESRFVRKQRIYEEIFSFKLG